MDSEYEGFDGFTEDSSMNGLFGNYAFIYIFKNFEMSQAPVERRAIICLERICKKRQKRTKVYSRDAKKNILFELLLFLSLPS